MARATAAAAVFGAISCAALGLLLRERRRRYRRRQIRLHTIAGSSCELHWAAAKDAPVVLSMIRGLADFENQADACVLTEAGLMEDLNDGHYECLLATSVGTDAGGGNCVGFALFHHSYSTSNGRGIYLHDLYVVPAARRTGVGLTCLRGVAAVAHSRRCQSLTWCAFDWNEKAIAFYKSAAVGAAEVGSRFLRAPEADHGRTVISFCLDAHGIARLAGEARNGMKLA